VIRMVALGHYHWNQLAFGTTTLVIVGVLAAVLRRLGSGVRHRSCV
jgi:hypothetical protein